MKAALPSSNDTNYPPCGGPRARKAGRKGSRQGMAVLMVLLLLSVTLGLTYAAMRSQITSHAIQRNSDRRSAARQAAITGLTLALKKMHSSEWSGVNSSVKGSVGAYESYLVTYATGDASLPSSDAEQPYRVTLLSTGYAADPQHPSSVAAYRVRAVVRLIPRKLADEPTDWQEMMSYTACQWSYGNFTMNAPARIEGPVRIQATLRLGWDYAWWMDPREGYYSGLGAMFRAGRGDYRPFNAQVSLPTWWQILDTTSTLSTQLAVPVANVSLKTMRGMAFPAALATYRLYPGGKLYTVPQLPRTIQNAVYEPDPETNPAGLFFRTGSLYLGDDVTIRGTVITAVGSGGRIQAAGQRVRLEAAPLPALYGTTEQVQLPAVVAGESFEVLPNTQLSVKGLVAAYSSFQTNAAEHTKIAISHQGKLIAQNIELNGGSDWIKSLEWWSQRYGAFRSQEAAKDGIPYFPEWLSKNYGLKYPPQVTIKPSETAVRYHWHNPQNAIYAADPSDGGLRWDLLCWTEGV